MRKTTAILMFVAATLAFSNSLMAGALPRAIDLRTSVRAFDTDRFEWTLFEGGRQARVEVNGDGDTDLDLYIYDRNDNLVAKDDDNLDYCVVRWFPHDTGYYRIVVRNRGSVPNVYTLRSN